MQTFTGLEYIKIDIANNYGNDKDLWHERIAFADEFLNSSESEQKKIMAEADEPILMQKAIYAYHDAMAGIPINFTMGLDATASGLQIMACLIGCHKTASNVNLVNTGKRECAYNKVTKTMNMPHITRADVKYPLMTHYYASTAMPKKIFGEESAELAAFYSTLMAEFPGAELVRDAMLSMWQGDAEAHQWFAPDEHWSRVRVGDYVNQVIEVDELRTGTGAKATFTHRAKVYAPAEKGISLAANIVHSLDGWVVREMRRRAKLQGFDIMAVHDQFWCHPNHMNKLRQNYLDILIYLNDHDILTTIFSTIAGRPVEFPKYENNLSALIKDAEYALS